MKKMEDQVIVRCENCEHCSCFTTPYGLTYVCALHVLIDPLPRDFCSKGRRKIDRNKNNEAYEVALEFINYITECCDINLMPHQKKMITDYIISREKNNVHNEKNE